MPFGKKSSPEDEQRKIQAQQDMETSLRSLEAGGLPIQAKRRLSEEVAAGHPLFTSDLSTNEFLLTRKLGYIPLSQVMGSSTYHVGWQYTRNYSWQTNEFELATLTQAHQNASKLALGRLEQEAALLKAHGVIGVRFIRRNYVWGSDLIEYTAIGTAIRLPNAPLPQRPFLSDLSGQEFWTLLQAGYYPAGLVTSFCSYCVSLGTYDTQQLTSWFFGGGFYNQEIVPFTQAIYKARDLGMYRLLESTRGRNATGVVGMHIELDKNLEEEEINDRKYLNFFVHFAAIGTTISEQKKDHVIPAPIPTLSFTDLRQDRYEETRELTIDE